MALAAHGLVFIHFALSLCSPLTHGSLWSSLLCLMLPPQSYLLYMQSFTLSMQLYPRRHFSFQDDWAGGPLFKGLPLPATDCYRTTSCTVWRPTSLGVIPRETYMDSCMWLTVYLIKSEHIRGTEAVLIHRKLYWTTGFCICLWAKTQSCEAVSEFRHHSNRSIMCCSKKETVVFHWDTKLDQEWGFCTLQQILRFCVDMFV